MTRSTIPPTITVRLTDEDRDLMAAGVQALALELAELGVADVGYTTYLRWLLRQDARRREVAP